MTISNLITLRSVPATAFNHINVRTKTDKYIQLNLSHANEKTEKPEN